MINSLYEIIYKKMLEGCELAYNKQVEDLKGCMGLEFPEELREKSILSFVEQFIEEYNIRNK